MNVYDKIRKKYYKRYSMGLERIIASSTSREEVIKLKALLAQELRQQFEEETKNIPNFMKKNNYKRKIASKIEKKYASSVNQAITDETETKRSMIERIKNDQKLANSVYESEVRNEQKKRKQRLWTGAVAGALLAGAITAGVYLASRDDMPQEPGIINTGDGENGGKVSLEKPEVVSYENENGTFQYLYNTVDVNYWAYNTVKNEVAEFNKNNPQNAFDIDMELLSGAIICGMQIRESSGELNCNKDNPDHQGPFSISTDEEYVAEINAVAKQLTGSNVIDVKNIKKDIQDPTISAKACVYFLIQNYETLQDILPENTKITQNMLIDSYLYGPTGVKNRLESGVYKGAMPYSSRIMEYSEVFEEYKQALDNNSALRSDGSTPEGRKAHQKLNQITEKYAGTDTYKRPGSTSEME